MKRKFNYLCLSFLVIFLMTQSSVGQNIKNDEVFFRLPEENVLTVVVIQNKSPIQFENIDVFFDKKAKSPFLNWGLKNNSSKTVRRFVVAFEIRTNIDQWRYAGRHAEYDIETISWLIYPRENARTSARNAKPPKARWTSAR